MKVKIPVLLLLAIAAAVGYMLGTENGRAQRDVLMVKLGKGPQGGADLEAVMEDAAEAVSDAASDVADAVEDATD